MSGTLDRWLQAGPSQSRSSFANSRREGKRTRSADSASRSSKQPRLRRTVIDLTQEDEEDQRPNTAPRAVIDLDSDDSDTEDELVPPHEASQGSPIASSAQESSNGNTLGYNAHRHRARRQERAAFGAEKVALKVDALQSALQPLASISRDLAVATLASPSGNACQRLEILLDSANVYSSCYQLEALEPDSFPTDLANAPMVLDLLHSLAEQHIAFDPYVHEQVGVFERCDSLDEFDNSTPTFRPYLRFLPFPNKTALLERVKWYEKAFPADVQLPAALRAACQDVQPTQKLWVPYAGITCAGSAADREQSDHEAADNPTRRANFVGDLRMQVFEITALRVPLASDQQWRTDPSLSNVERLLVSLLRGRGLNSAHGGYFWRPSINERQAHLISAVRQSLTTTPPLQEKEQLLSTFDRIGHAEDLALSSAGIQLPNAAGLELVRDLASSWRCHDDRVVSLIVAKDVTEECRSGMAPFWSLSAGPGPNSSRYLWNCVFGRYPDVEAPSSAAVSQLFYAVIDLLPKDRSFEHLFLHCAILSLKLYWLKPRVISVESSQVWHVVSSGLLIKWTEWASAEELNQFYDHFDGSVLTVIQSRMRSSAGYPDWTSCKSSAFLEVLGHPTAVHVAPRTWLVGMATLHNGSWKRAPALSPQYTHLHVLSRLSHMVAEDTAVAERGGCSRADVLALTARITDRLVTLNIMDELQAASRKLRELLSPLTSLQVSTAALRQSNGTQGHKTPASDSMPRLGNAFPLKGTMQSATRIQQTLDWSRQAKALYEEGNLSSPLLHLVLGDALPGTLEWAEVLVERYCVGDSLQYISNGTLAPLWDQRTAEQVESDNRRRNQRAQAAQDRKTGGTTGRRSAMDYLLGQAASCRPKTVDLFVRQCPSTTCSAGTWLSDQSCRHACSESTLDEFFSDFDYTCPGHTDESLMDLLETGEETFMPRLSTAAQTTTRAHLARMGLVAPGDLVDELALIQLRESNYSKEAGYLAALRTESQQSMEAQRARDKAAQEAYRLAGKPPRGPRATGQEGSLKAGKPYWDGNLLKVPTGVSNKKGFRFLNSFLGAPYMGPWLQQKLFSITPHQAFYYSLAKEYLTEATQSKLRRTFGETYDFDLLGYVVWLQADELEAGTNDATRMQLYNMISRYVIDLATSLIKHAQDPSLPSMSPIQRPNDSFATRKEKSAVFDVPVITRFAQPSADANDTGRSLRGQGRGRGRPGRPRGSRRARRGGV